MRRIFQIGTILLLLAVFLAPVFEFFDRWAAPGLGNDTEMAVLCFVLLLCLLLAASPLGAAGGARIPGATGGQASRGLWACQRAGLETAQC